MWNWLSTRRKRIEEALAGTPAWHHFSPALYAQYRAVAPLMRRYIRGRTIDLGCGYTPFRYLLKDQVTVYHTLDRWPRSNGATYVGDVQDMPMVPAGSYDSAICLEVLEHVPHPLQALREIYRILRPGGRLLLSVPHLSRLHDLPYDYFRFTHLGLRVLLETAGFEVVEIDAKGGLFAFLGHQVSTLVVTAAWPAWGVRQLVWFLNKWLITRFLYEADRVIGWKDLFALGYVGVAQKPIEE